MSKTTNQKKPSSIFGFKFPAYSIWILCLIISVAFIVKIVFLLKNNELEKSARGEATSYLRSILMAENAYFLENGEFARTVEKLNFGFMTQKSNNNFYKYQFLDMSKMNTFISMAYVATPKALKLKSYTGVILFNHPPDSSKIYKQIFCICATTKPNLSPPTYKIHTFENQSGKKISCSVASQTVSYSEEVVR